MRDFKRVILPETNKEYSDLLKKIIDNIADSRSPDEFRKKTTEYLNNACWHMASLYILFDFESVFSGKFDYKKSDEIRRQFMLKFIDTVDMSVDKFISKNRESQFVDKTKNKVDDILQSNKSV